MKTFTRILRLATLGLCLAAGAAQAQGYPNRPVRIVVPFAAGGPADNYARFIAQRLGEEFKQSFVIENPAESEHRFLSAAKRDGLARGRSATATGRVEHPAQGLAQFPRHHG